MLDFNTTATYGRCKDEETVSTKGTTFNRHSLWGPTNTECASHILTLQLVQERVFERRCQIRFRRSLLISEASRPSGGVGYWKLCRTSLRDVFDVFFKGYQIQALVLRAFRIQLFTRIQYSWLGLEVDAF